MPDGLLHWVQRPLHEPAVGNIIAGIALPATPPPPNASRPWPFAEFHTTIRACSQQSATRATFICVLMRKGSDHPPSADLARMTSRRVGCDPHLLALSNTASPSMKCGPSHVPKVYLHVDQTQRIDPWILAMSQACTLTARPQRLREERSASKTGGGLRPAAQMCESHRRLLSATCWSKVIIACSMTTAVAGGEVPSEAPTGLQRAGARERSALRFAPMQSGFSPRRHVTQSSATCPDLSARTLTRSVGKMGPKSGGRIAQHLADFQLPELGIGRKSVQPSCCDDLGAELHGASSSDVRPFSSLVRPVPEESGAIQ